MDLYTVDVHPNGHAVEAGTLLFVTAVRASNIVKDLRENIRNLTGGQMRQYEGLLNDTMVTGLEKLVEQLEIGQWDGALGIRVSHPHVADGGCEIVIIATPFRYSEVSRVR